MLRGASILWCVVSLTAAAAACSANGGSDDEGGSGGVAGVGATSGTGGNGNAAGVAGTSGSAGLDASAGSGGSAGAASGGAAGLSGSGGSSAGASGSGGSSGSAGSGGSGGTLIGFDGGWVIPDAGNPDPVDGNGAVDVIIGPGADTNTPGRFGGVASGQAPTAVYPLDATMLPPNLEQLDVHFRPAPGQTHFELSFVGPTRTLKVYLGCTPLGGGCSWASERTDFWNKLAPSARGTAPVRWRVRGVTVAGAIGESPERELSFSRQDLLGGIYYWNTAGLGRVQRRDFGIPGAPIENYLDVTRAGGGTCLGCHTMSRDGESITVGLNIPAPAQYKSFDVVSRLPVNPRVDGNANFFSYAPDAQYLLVSNGVGIGLRSMQTGAMLNANVVPYGTMPDWSPSGTRMVYSKPRTRPVLGLPIPGVDSASLEIARFNGVGFDAPTTLVPQNGGNNYYASFSPDESWVAFNRSPGNKNSFENAGPGEGGVPDGELWVVATTGGTAIRQTRASSGGWLQWPKWAPAKHDSYVGKVLWLTFSSQRAYGLRLAEGEQTQLFMVAIDVGKLGRGQDGSFSPFWLPTQDIGGGNHIAQWTTKVPRKPCRSRADCEGNEVCTQTRCVPEPR